MHQAFSWFVGDVEATDAAGEVGSNISEEAHLQARAFFGEYTPQNFNMVHLKMGDP